MPSLSRAAFPLALIALGAFAAPAGAEIVPQDNIAGVKIGMSQDKVLDLLGSPAKTITRLGGGGGETPITTYTYKRRGIKVDFVPNRANTKNVAFSIQVYRGRKQLTAQGIGLGSKRSAVKAKVPGAKCRRYDPTYAICLVGTGDWGKISTTFRLNERNKVDLILLSKPLDA